MNTTQTAAVGEVPSVNEVIETMRASGGWYLRKRRRVLPALWRDGERGTYAAARPKDVEQWLLAKFARCASMEKRDVLRLAEAIIAELRYHDHGIPTIDDATIELIT